MKIAKVGKFTVQGDDVRVVIGDGGTLHVAAFGIAGGSDIQRSLFIPAGHWPAFEVTTVDDAETDEQEKDSKQRLLNCRALLERAEQLLRGTPDANRTNAQRDLLFDIEAMKGRC